MSAGPISRERAAWEPARPSLFRPGKRVAVDAGMYPPGFPTYRIAPVDGSIATLTPTDPDCPFPVVKRYVANLRILRDDE